MYRFAPSPTGDMHIGNLRVALFNYICARQKNTDFILRIEDTDKARNIEGKEEEIKEILKIFGICWQHYYIQSQNLKFHRQMALKLVSEKKAFACFCTEEELEIKKEFAKKQGKAYRYDGTCENLSHIELLECEKPFVIRIKKPNHTLKFTDLIKGQLGFTPENIDSFVIMRKDKTPTYNFACAVDDMLENVTCIIRGEDHVSNTPKQEHIRASLNYNYAVTYAHLPIILNEENTKMSKREAHSSVKWLLEQGILPSAIANYLIILGNKTPHEIFTLEEAIEWFDIAKVSKAPARFDFKKLLQINREHIKKMPDEELNKLLNCDKNLAKLAKFYTQEASTLKELKEKIQAIFSAKDYKEFTTECVILKNILQKMQSFENYEDFKNELLNQSALKGKKFFMPLRIILTGNTHGPELNELYPYIKQFIYELARI
ncbi:glutamate--tRNA ligase [Campylobacter sp. VicNov18]|uniref:glutamate--tRNA ligase n=1 Tax=Campylobacter bilis TaxID=2691918 RepID=UPI00130DFD03|nr:glutamate--tRNA ligase [Campylobacter bilis]MPV63549.1 glutamate--tRNA ligase [Campylobacter hepaticus]MBM0637049.1 glutamate--tRNA ligase [Campylobacter bilis]MCC8277793.1 glutamate--tRNA ligase [Campylobacter bilis]MCC8299402.1 glutamate--tRNA ligase [Campylobacter bilis]MCC8300702.1 glutamate--tRNA ligase [Campylobacter bilis]